MNVAGYAKSFAALLGSALTVAITQYPHSPWIPVATAAATVVGVYAVPNTSGKSTVVPAADIGALVSSLIAAIEAIHPGPPAMGTDSASIPPPVPVSSGGLPSDSAGPWAGTQAVADNIAAETAFRSFEDRVFPS